MSVDFFSESNAPFVPNPPKRFKKSPQNAKINDENCHVNLRTTRQQTKKLIPKKPIKPTKPYYHDIHQSQKKTEMKFFSLVGNGIVFDGTDINPAMRAILVNWLSEVRDEYKLKTQTLFLSIAYLDRFLQVTNNNNHNIHRHLLQLVGITCLWVAAKFEEVEVPDVTEFSYITDNTYSVKEIISVERYLLNKLNYDLACVTVENFLFRYMEIGGISDEQIIIHSQFIGQLSLTYYPIHKLFQPSLIAASIVCLMKHTYQVEPICSIHFLNYTGFSKEQLLECVKELIYMYQNLIIQPTAIVQRYHKDEYKRVATVPLRENLEF